ncbi:MAG: tetratricopeptide repeat protein [Marinilabiliaceae bacterium]|nr:tetratricopeptide repeat protein [Marinilabiliaceae bacterium]
MKRLIMIGSILTSCCWLNAQQADVLKSDAIIQESKMQYLKAAVLYEKANTGYGLEQKVDTFCLFKAGQNYCRAKQFDKAVLPLEKAYEMNYPEADLFLSLADAYGGIKKFDKAEFILKEGKNRFEEKEEEFNKKMGYLFYNSGQYAKAVTALELAIAQSPQNVTFLYLHGSSLERLKKYPEAIQSFENVLLLKPNHKKATKKLGVIYFRQTDYLYEKETKRYESMKSPTRVNYHNSTKKLEGISKGYEKALPYLEKSHEASPKDKAIISCLSIAYRRLKMTEKADQMKAI